jgi:ankyrin repeat protein
MTRRPFLQIVGVVAAGAFVLGTWPARADRDADLLHAVEVDDDQGVASLLAQGADPNVKDSRGQVALYVALRDGSPKSARVLVAAKDLQVDAVNAGGETPLMMAALRGNLEIAQALLDRSAAAHRTGWSPLHYAATGGNPAMVRLFLAKGAPVDARAPNGRTPLMMAARYGGSDAAEVLLEAGADRALVDDAGRDAAANADAGGNDAVATWLREWHPKRTPR